MSETTYEKQYLGRGQMKIQAKKDHSYAIILILLVLAITLFNVIILNPWWKTVPVQNPAVAALSDRQQEQFYCGQWMKGNASVKGASTEAIKSHCKEMGV